MAPPVVEKVEKLETARKATFLLRKNLVGGIVEKIGTCLSLHVQNKEPHVCMSTVFFNQNLGALAHRPSRGANGKQNENVDGRSDLVEDVKVFIILSFGCDGCWRVLGLDDIDAVLCLGERERSGRSGCSYRGSLLLCDLHKLLRFVSNILGFGRASFNCLTNERRKINLFTRRMLTIVGRPNP